MTGREGDVEGGENRENKREEGKSVGGEKGREWRGYIPL